MLRQLLDAAIAGAATGPVTARAVSALAIPRERRVWLFAVGKAAHGMARAAVGELQRSLNPIVGGLVVAPELAPPPYGTLTALQGDHPVPGSRSLAAAVRVGEIAARMKSGDVALVLVSGGASSLIAAPLKGLDGGDLSRLYETLLASGLDIAATNAVRKRFSRWGGGRLAHAIAPATTYCLAVSDVIGDDISTIGSGPCVPDPVTADDVIATLEDANLLGKLTKPYRTYLADVSRGAEPETPKRDHPAFAHVSARVIANNRGALEAAAERARASGAAAVYVVDKPLAGEAAVAGENIARWLLELREKGDPAVTRTPRIAIWGGETTVTLGSSGDSTRRGAPAPGAALGGRCQELALAAARTLNDAGDRARGIALLAAGTDGRDGPTDAAGAIVDGTTWHAIAAAGIDADRALAEHASYDALAGANALLVTGPTGTNVMDVVIGLVGGD